MLSFSDREKWLQRLQWAGLFLMMTGLAFSHFMMSVSVLLLSAVFIFFLLHDRLSGGNPKERFLRFTRSRLSLLFISLFIAFCIGMMWSSDWSYGLKDLKVKLPFLVLPIVISGLQPVSEKAIRQLLIFFIASLVLAVSICISVYFGLYQQFAVMMGWKIPVVKDIRGISIYISHIRFSLLLVVGISVLLTKFFSSPAERIVSSLIILLFLSFLWLIESITGYAVLFALFVLMGISVAISSRNRQTKISAVLMLLLSATVVTVFIYMAVHNYFAVDRSETAHLETYTRYGEKYEHHPESDQIENGHYVMINIAWGEMADAWERRSSIGIEEQDSSGNILKGTLIRYLTSKGLKKDRDGVMALDEEDVRQIENGIPNATWKEKSGLRLRIERILFEYNHFRSGGSPGGHSVFQRLEFWKTAWGIIAEHPIAGVGTGDVPSSFTLQYEKRDAGMNRIYWLRAHNQFLTVWIALGIFGLCWFIWVLVYPFSKQEFRSEKLFIAFWVTAILSFLTEDTLESQAGVSFFVFITAFLIFLPRKDPADILRQQG